MEIRWSWKVYAVAGAVFVLSTSVALWLPVSDTFRGVASVPGAAALVGVLVQLWRDALARQHEAAMRQREHDFSLSVASHMAHVVFDKHVAFCEEYFARVHDGWKEVVGSGPRDRAREIAGELTEIRRKYSPWLTKDIDEHLFPMEHALIKMGAAAGVLDSLPVGDSRTKLVEQMHQAWSVFVGMTPGASDEEKRTAKETILEHLRDVLGTRELTQLRTSAVRAARGRANESKG